MLLRAKDTRIIYIYITKSFGVKLESILSDLPDIRLLRACFLSLLKANADRLLAKHIQTSDSSICGHVAVWMMWVLGCDKKEEYCAVTGTSSGSSCTDFDRLYVKVSVVNLTIL